MSLSLAKHPILLCAPLAAAAVERLGHFFDVRQTAPHQACGEDLYSALAGNAAVLITGRHCLDAGLLARLPLLKAVCVLGALHAAMDLPALTHRGIRVTRVEIGEACSGLDLITAMEAAEQLIAALGFGRDGWHPGGLINPEVACGSCC
ncbi:hypothetical protein [Sodalis sp. dw_96]|uniref:hypothetical protein n=1 Tax=Sodalis sp. dw_96 TaxID=2719794 RepID=UPI001BD5B864|nr:hypothetical protein [Sodalis sp. dw_96]